MKNNRIPSYYIGRRYKIEARKVIEDFDLSYNVGTACTYCGLYMDSEPTEGIPTLQRTEPSLTKRRDKLWEGAKEKLVGSRGINESFD